MADRRDVLRDGGREAQRGSKLVEGALADRARMAPGEETDSGDQHDGEDGPQPVRRGGRDVDVGDKLSQTPASKRCFGSGQSADRR